MFFVVDIFLKTSIFKALCSLKSCLSFDCLIYNGLTDVDLAKMFFTRKSAIYHSIKRPFDTEFAEKILNAI